MLMRFAVARLAATSCVSFFCFMVYNSILQQLQFLQAETGWKHFSLDFGCGRARFQTWNLSDPASSQVLRLRRQIQNILTAQLGNICHCHRWMSSYLAVQNVIMGWLRLLADTSLRCSCCVSSLFCSLDVTDCGGRDSLLKHEHDPVVFAVVAKASVATAPRDLILRRWFCSADRWGQMTARFSPQSQSRAKTVGHLSDLASYSSDLLTPPVVFTLSLTQESASVWL